MYGAKYREELINQIRALAKDLDEMAPQLVGESEMITDFGIELVFDRDCVPVIKLKRNHLGQHTCGYYFNKEE